MNFEQVKELIATRRSGKPALMNGKKIDDGEIQQLLELGDWAPTHAHTEPWRFVVYTNAGIARFSHDHAELYKASTPAESFETAKYEKLLHNADLASHIVIVYMKRGNNPKITAVEEVCATAAAIQNILLGASALGIAALWSTGGLVLHPAMKNYLGLQEEDRVLGMLYLGYSDAPPKAARRVVPLAEKTAWNG